LQPKFCDCSRRGSFVTVSHCVSILCMNELTDQRISQAIRRKNLRRFYWIGGSILILAAVIWLIVIIQKKATVLPPDQTLNYEQVGREHIALNDPLPKAYNSNPPSSGAHYSSPANWNVYDYEINDRIFIHNLEHGGIWIAYKPSVSPDVVKELKAIVDGFGGLKIVMAPRSANDGDVAIVAWTHVYKFNVSGGHLSDQQKTDMGNFYKSFLNHGPEDVPSFMGGVDPKEAK